MANKVIASPRAGFTNPGHIQDEISLNLVDARIGAPVYELSINASEEQVCRYIAKEAEKEAEKIHEWMRQYMPSTVYRKLRLRLTQEFNEYIQENGT